MLIDLISFDGHDINDGTSYRAYLVNQRGGPAANATFIEQANADAVDSGLFTVDTQTLVVKVEVRDYGNREALIAQLQRWFKRGTRGALVGHFSDDNDDYTIYARVVNLAPEPGHALSFNAILQTGSSTWRAVAADVQSVWVVDGTGDSDTFTVAGNDEARLIASFSPQEAPGSGYFYQRVYQLPNKPGVNFGYRPWCITINTDALVTATKMRSDCFDLRIFIGDVEVPRWISGANTTTTKVWFNVWLGEGFSLTLKDGVTDAETVTHLEFLNTATMEGRIAAMPTEGYVARGNEWFYYNGKTKYGLTIVTRGAWGTTQAAHSTNDVFVYVQNPIRVLYGKSAATDPALADENYDAEKPVFNLSSSDNGAWVYDDSGAGFVGGGGRTGGWQTELKRRFYNLRANFYSIEENDESGDPAMGMLVGTFDENVPMVYFEMSYWLYCAGGISEITATGKKFRSSAEWVSKMGFQRSADQAEWFDLWEEAAPTAVNEFQSWATHSEVAVASGSKWVRMFAMGNSPSGVGNYWQTEALSVTVEFTSSNIPTGTLLGEGDGFDLEFWIHNDTNGDAVRVKFAALENKAFVLNSEEMTASFEGVPAHRSVTLNDEGRSVWLRLAPGDNVIRIAADADVGEFDAVLSWYARRLV